LFNVKIIFTGVSKRKRNRSSSSSFHNRMREVDIGRGQSVGEVAMFASSSGGGGRGGKANTGATHTGSCIAIRDTELVRRKKKCCFSS
jgi:hypothetical protein